MTKKDRLSIHIDNGQTDIYEAVTVLRNGGTTSQSGLVGITNIQSQPNSAVMPSAVLPETVLNVQTSGFCDVRFSSHETNGDSRLILAGNGNGLASGLSIKHLSSTAPRNYFSFIGQRTSEASAATFGDTVAANFGLEIPFLAQQATSSSQEKYAIGLGTPGYAGQDMNATVYIAHSGDSSMSGVLGIREQSRPPSSTSDFGKIYVRSYTPAGTTQSQALYFQDDNGNEYNLTVNEDDSLAGHVYGNVYGNTYAGWYSPSLRLSTSSINRNSYFGYGIQFVTGNDNTLVGYQPGSGSEGGQNTVVGCQSFYNFLSSNRNIIIGHKNAFVTDQEETRNGLNDCLIIGNELFSNEVPDRYTLALGVEGSPFVTGLMKGAKRNFTILSSDGEDTRFKLQKGSLDYNLGHEFINGRHNFTFGVGDAIAPAQGRGMMSMRFTNKDGVNQTLMDFDPSGTINKAPTFDNPDFKRPTVSISGDLRILGDIRFGDSTSLNSVGGLLENRPLSNSGILRTYIDGIYYWGLEFGSMPLATSLADEIIPSQSYLPLDVNLSKEMGKISISDLAAYVSSGTASFGMNCNGLFTNVSNFDDIDQNLNSHSVFIGCDVAANATGWKHGIFIGTEAGRDSTTINGGLSSDTAPVYIGYQAGHTASNTDNCIFIGNGAGKNADSSIKSIFIGPGAGTNATNANSIGIGQHALEGEISEAEGGQRNIEIVAGLDDNQRLFYTQGELSNRLNIQNTIAANTQTPSVSIGKASLFPSGAPLEVVRDTTDAGYTLGHTNPNVQYWINNDAPVARVSESGHLITQTSGVNHSSQPSQTVDSWFGTHEGFMEDYIYAPSSFNSPTSGWMVTRSYEAGFAADRRILVINRDIKQDIHGNGAVGGAAYVVTMMVNGEHRPVYISCSGSS